MADPSTDKSFTGSIPKNYEAFLVPLIFVPYAVDLSRRVASLRPSHVLEVAAGTGVVTRALVTALPGSTDIVATDLNPAMIEQAAAIGTGRPVEWKVADATDLPFSDEAFDVVYQMGGINFFSDQAQAIREMVRVAKKGTKIVIMDETEKVAKTLENVPGINAWFRHHRRPIVPPVEYIPSGMEEVETCGLYDGQAWLISFRKPH